MPHVPLLADGTILGFHPKDVPSSPRASRGRRSRRSPSNRRAAEELETRLADALAPLGHAPGTVRVRTFHALGREILGDAGTPVEPKALGYPLPIGRQITQLFSAAMAKVDDASRSPATGTDGLAATAALSMR